MPPVIDIARDEEGLRQAALEVLAVRFAHEYESAMAARAGAEFHPAEPDWKLAQGYYARVEHLIELESRVRFGVQVNLQFDEFVGLVAVAVARKQFDAAHPQCPHCEAPLAKATDTRCWRCWHELKEN